MFNFEGKEQNEQVQGSLAWRELRKKSIGASDVPTIFGLNKYQTAQKLWEVKTGLSNEDEVGYAAMRGKASEPIIKALFESQMGVKIQDKVVTYKDWSVMIASLDGYFEDDAGGVVVEFKYPSKEKYELAKSGSIPKDHYLQVQAQLLCANAQNGYYVSFDGEDIAIVSFTANEVIQKEIVSVCKEFWRKVQNKTPIVQETNDQEIIDKLAKRELIKLEIEAKQDVIDEIDSWLKQRLENYSGKKIGNFSVSWVEKKGNVNYKNIPELKGVDLEKYRGVGTRYLKIGGSKNE